MNTLSVFQFRYCEVLYLIGSELVIKYIRISVTTVEGEQ